MASVSGIDCLFQSIEEIAGVQDSVYVPKNAKSPTFLKRLAQKFVHKPSVTSGRRAGSVFSGPLHDEAARVFLSMAIQKPEARLVLSAAENQIGEVLATAPADVRRRVCAIVHQPPAWHRLRNPSYDHYAGLQKIICVSECQAKFFNEKSLAPVAVIRHGVRHDFFCPGNSPKQCEIDKLLFVGHWLRDLDTLTRAMKIIWREKPSTTLDCVLALESRNDFALYELAQDDRVRWHSGIKAESLRELYRTSDLLFLPLLDATANNAIVEALACGLPVVTSNVGGIAQYVREGTGQLCNAGSSEEHAQVVCEWLKDRNRLAVAREAARQFAVENLGWNEIAREFIDIVG
ncbi:MAG: glycosyltransferase family 4 protein [Aureliella sp.]